MPIKTVSIIVNAASEEAAKAVANQIVENTQAVAEWANKNYEGQINSVSARTQEVKVTVTESKFSKGVDNMLSSVDAQVV